MKKNPSEQNPSFSSIERKLAIEFLKEHREKLLLEKDKYVWEKNARPNQLPPKRFTKWLCIAGRGWGKTRVLTEFCRMKAFTMPGSHGVIVGRTAADVRDVIVEGGESSLLKISPPDFYPKYEPSKKRLTWPNGSTANLYSADEPDSLRGPQCLVGSTLVSMADGSLKRIDSIVSGEYVITRKGPRKVLKSWMSNPMARAFRLLDSSGRVIMGTHDHLVFSQGKFVPISNLPVGAPLCVTPVSSGAAIRGIRDRQGKTEKETTTRGAFRFIERFGSTTRGSCRLDIRSITRMRISTITTSQTLRSSLTASTPNCTPRPISGRIENKLSRVCWQPATGKTQDGSLSTYSASAVEEFTTVVPCGRESIAPRSVRSAPRVSSSTRSQGIANGARRSLWLHEEFTGIARENAMPMLALSVTRDGLSQKVGKSFATIAPRHSWQSSAIPDFAVAVAPSTTTARVVSVLPLNQRQPVYDIEVEGEHEFFANGILVHNCHWGAGDELAAWSTKKDDTEAYDNFMFGCRLKYKGLEPQVMFATTPKPNKIVRALLESAKNPRSGVVAVRGSTYENRANLAEKFFNEIITQYEGTRIGRQELDGELLEDIPGQLWTPQMFDTIRVRRDSLPEMLRIVVAIDPSVSSGENSDECGIVVVGMGVDGLFYLLQDASGVMSPSTWAKEAIAKYHQWHADCIIGEKNNGGDLVETNLRTVDEFIPYHSVWASHGKAVRAQPIAGLYEQCIGSGSLVSTDSGVVPIEDVIVGSMVWTRDGLRKVLFSGQTGISPLLRFELLDGKFIECTEQHKIFTSRGWLSAKDIVHSDKITIWDNVSIATPLYRRPEDAVSLARPRIDGPLQGFRLDRSLSSEDCVITSKRTAIIEPEDTQETGNSTIGPYGSMPTVDCFGMMKMSITSMKTGQTTSQKTSLLFHGRSIKPAIPGNLRIKPSETKSVLARKFAWLKGLHVSMSAGSVVEAFCLQGLSSDSALRPAIADIGIKSIAAKKARPVYDLMVEGEEEFFANGILVHNCRVRHLLPSGSGWTTESEGKKFTTGFEKLETQYCGFTNQEYEGEGSPDRAEAAIWGLAEFVENGRTTSRMFPDFRAERRFVGHVSNPRYTEPENAIHVKVTPADVKPWWPRWISVNLDRTESAAHWWFKEPSGRVRIYRELVVQGALPEAFGVAIANASLQEIQSQRSVPVWMAEEYFERQGVKSVAASVADGIKRTLGEHKAFMFVHDATEMDIQDQNKRVRAIEGRLARMPGGFLCIRSLHGSKETGSGWDIVSDMLKWRKVAPKAKQETPNWTKAMQLGQTDIMAYTAYMAQFMNPTEADVVAPLLLMDTSCSRLIQAMSGAAAGENGKLADSITGSVLQSLRIGALASRENASREPEEEFIARKMDRMPPDASPISMHIQFERAQQEYRGSGNDGVSLHRVAAPPRLRVM